MNFLHFAHGLDTCHMRSHKSKYFNTCTIIIKLTAIVVFGVFALFGCNKRPQQLLKAQIIENSAAERLDLNRATASEIAELPGIGPQLAARIVEHRDRFGPFSDPREVLLVRGMSDARYRAIRDLVTSR